MIELMERLAELCPKWCAFEADWIRVQAQNDFHYVNPDSDDVDNSAALIAIVERMVEEGWGVNRYYCRQHGVMFHDCELVWPDDSRDTILTAGGSETEAVLKAAVAAFGPQKEPPSAR